MLHLATPSPDRWFAQVAANLGELLLDHAHCEKKAAGTAMNLLFAYVEHAEVTTAMTEIVREELDHFQQVLALLAARGIKFKRIKPSAYGQRLHEQVRKLEPGRAVDRLLVAGLIEARSCERFGILRDRLANEALASFYDSLFESEARHHATYTRLACLFAPERVVQDRLDELAKFEGQIIQEGEPWARMHS
jgi:tRNA-(ms[2]io[6]A)-hydroxylase